MDIFITIVLWIVGFYAFAILGLALVFAAAGAAQTGNGELKIISILSFVLMMYLIWIGVSSVFFSSDVDVNIPVGKDGSETYEILLWVFYAIFFSTFLFWLFAPSKNKGEGKDLVKKKFLGSIKLEEDESGRKPWDPNWKPKE